MSRPKLPSSSPKQMWDFPLHMADPLVCSTPTFDTDKPTKLHTDPENNNKTKKVHKQNTSNQCLSRQQEPTLILAVECHRGMPCGEVFPLVCTFGHTHNAQKYTPYIARTHSCKGKGLAFSQRSCCARERRVNCFIHTADGRSLASPSVTLTQQEKRGEKHKAGDIEGKGVKRRNREGNKNKKNEKTRRLTSFTFRYPFLLSFSAFLLPEREILSTWYLSHFSSPDVQRRQIRRQGIMVASSSVLRGRKAL